MVKRARWGAGISLALLVILWSIASCTAILGIDTEHDQNPCNDGEPDPPLQCGEGACMKFLDACDAKGLPVTCEPGQPQDADTCKDGLDNDCDGSVDENDSGECTCGTDGVTSKACYSGSAETRNKGLCRDGLQSCNGTWGPCEGDVLPVEEIADGLDNDCDGQIDDGVDCEDGAQQYCYGGPEETIGKGSCKQGTQACKGGLWDKCVGQTLPSIEICDGFDNDCDGLPDPFPCECEPPGSTQKCFVNEAGDPIPCPDDLKGACECGTQTCTDGKYGLCVGAIVAASKDVCDGSVDDDCDGIVDNVGQEGGCACLHGATEVCYDGPAGTENVPPCQKGMRTCKNGQWGPCEGQIIPKNEVCDGFVDDDCDTIIDNVNPQGPCLCLSGTVSECYTGEEVTKEEGTCVNGTSLCVNGQPGPCNGQKLPTPEICDGLDNDCNGASDDGVAGVNEPCFLPQYADTPCHQGTMKCQIGDTVPKCVANVQPGSVVEDCDGIDDNCDGFVDNGFFCCPNDGKQSGNETDIDCGGSCAAKCANNQKCGVGIDCQSGNCFINICKSPTCDDNVINGGESDVDCGIVCPEQCTVGQSCNLDADCVSNLCQAANKKCIQKPLGASCAASPECQSGNCVDNVCCDLACTGVCQACTAEKKGPGGGPDGICDDVQDNTDPDDDCTAQLASTCQSTGQCVGGACANYGPGTTCAPASCSSETMLNKADICDGNGACLLQSDQDCTPYKCSGTACLTQCTTDGQCAAGYYCNSPACVLKKQLGVTCVLDSECQLGNCEDGVCCNTPCVGTCQACNVAGNLGVCSAIPVNQDPAGECPANCDGQGQCQKPNGQPCTGSGQCASNLCVDGVCCNTTCLGTCQACDVAGNVGTCTNIPVNTDPFNECPAGACDGTGACQGQTSTPCTTPDQCANGLCVDGFCCDVACAGACTACSVALKGSGVNGVCGPVAANTDPNGECPAECNGAGSCEAPNGTTCSSNAQCQSGFCADGVCCNAPCGEICKACNVVNNVGNCVAVPANQDPANECTPGACDGIGACQNENGTTCSSNAQCTSGFCVDGVCCDTACGGTCQACTTALKGAGMNGVCGPVLAGTDPAGECAQNPASSCDQTGACNGAGACQLYPGGTECVAASCQGPALKANADTCNGTGLCQDNGTTDCTPFACNGGACKAMCTQTSDCAPDYYCVAPACLPEKPAGATCNSAQECSTGFCVDGVCCTTSCTGECKTCALAGNLGTCANVPFGQPDATPSCQGAQLCNGTGTCLDTIGQPCTANGECLTSLCVDGFCCSTACTGLCSACAASKTGGANGTCSAITTGSDPDNECAGATACNGMGACGLLPQGAPCGAAAECSTGVCTDGFCCDTVCVGTCKACSAAKTGGLNGTCANVAADTDPDNECPTECNNLGACEKTNGSSCATGAECQSGNCVDGVCCNAACNGDCQACNLVGNNGTCSPVAAGQQDTCGMGAVCDAGGTCKKTNATACGAGTECLSGNCVDGVCCNTTCGATCAACDLSGSVGTCTNVPNGQDPDSECVGATSCNGANACALFANGTACTLPAECTSGSCVDGVCCNTACNGSCQACTTMLKGSGANGTCGPIAANTDPQSECPTECNGLDGCEDPNGSACALDADCQSGICSGDGVCCNDDCLGLCEACDVSGAVGTCTAVPSGQDPDSECVGGTSCNGSGMCALFGAGTACMQNAECSSTFCVDNVCCNNACGGTCQACSASLTGGADGTCAPVLADTDPQNECPTECDGAGACEAANGTACSSAAQCQSGFCVDGVCCNGACGGSCEACTTTLKGSGANGVCGFIGANADPESECPTECDGAGACEAANGAACSSAAQCQSGFCIDGVCCNGACGGSCEACDLTGLEGTCSLVPANADPDNECTTECNGAGACEAANGVACSSGSQCQSGNCVDGVCCNSACGGACEACTTALKGSGADGVCGFIAADTDPQAECSAECSGAGACEAANGDACAVDADCQSGECVDGVCCDTACDSTCEACNLIGLEGTCSLVPANADPDSECATECNGAGACEAANGTACTSGGECQSNQCVDGVCCNNVCGGTCQACNLSGTEGTCTFIPVETDPMDECTGNGGDDVCNGAGVCKEKAGSSCVAGTECASGICADTVCCNTSCTGLCRSCNLSGTEGTCTFIASGTDPFNECGGGNPNCNGNGACGN